MTHLTVSLRDEVLQLADQSKLPAARRHGSPGERFGHALAVAAAARTASTQSVALEWALPYARALGCAAGHMPVVIEGTPIFADGAEEAARRLTGRILARPVLSSADLSLGPDEAENWRLEIFGGDDVPWEAVIDVALDITC